MGSVELGFEHVLDRSDTADPPYTLLLLHGTGADQHDLVPLGRSVAPDATLLSPLGKVRENGMPRWFRRVEEGVFDEADLRRRAAELAGFIEAAAREYDLDPDRIVALGFSNGANIAATLLLRHPDVLRGAVLLRAMTPLVPDERPDLTGVPVHIASGERDPLIDTEDAAQLAGMLSEAGAEVTHRFADAGHGLERAEIDEVRVWLGEQATTFAKPREAQA